MMLGYKGEAELIRSWEKKYKTPIFTAGQNHVSALRALGIKKYIGASYSGAAKQNCRRLHEPGRLPSGVDGSRSTFLSTRLARFQPKAATRTSKGFFVRTRELTELDIQGGAWRTEGIVQMLEQDLQVPVVHANLAQVWEI